MPTIISLYNLRTNFEGANISTFGEFKINKFTFLLFFLQLYGLPYGA